MKNALIVMTVSLLAAIVQAKTAECTFNDGTILRATITESSMMADLSQISIQRPGQEVQNFSDNVQGSVYTNISGNPEDSVVLDIWENADPENKPMFSITSSEEGNSQSGSTVIEFATGAKQSVTCKEIE
jgi:hypothetical protein